VIVSLSAATSGFVSASDSVAIASDAGFGHVGLRLDLAPPTAKELALTRRRLNDTGCRVFDIEVALMGRDHVSADRQQLVDLAAELGASHLLCVGEGHDRSVIADQLADLDERCAEVGISAALEWMPFRSVATLDDAVEVISLTGSSRIGVVVDALHSARSGGKPADLLAHHRRVAYLQLCDAPVVFDAGNFTDQGHATAHLAGTLTSPDRAAELAREARTARLLPGQGELPLRELIDLFPGVPVSLEVPPTAGLDRAETIAHASAVRRAYASLLDPR